MNVIILFTDTKLKTFIAENEDVIKGDAMLLAMKRLAKSLVSN
jgi:hypothetical protein